MREVSFGQDGDFSEERFRNIVNANLANDIGNLLNRTLTLLGKNCNGQIPIDTATLSESHPLRELAAKQAPAVAGAFARMRFNEACEAALVLSGQGNVYLEQTAPWTAFKKGDDAAKAEAAASLAAVLEAVRIVAVMLMPVTPGLSSRIYQQLGLDQAGVIDGLQWEKDTRWGALKTGHATAVPSPVFTRLEGDWVTEAAPAVAAQQSSGGEKSSSKKQKKAKPVEA